MRKFPLPTATPQVTRRRAPPAADTLRVSRRLPGPGETRPARKSATSAWRKPFRATGLAPWAHQRWRVPCSFAAEQGRSSRGEFFFLFGIDLGVFEVERGERIDHRRGDDHARKP